MRCSRGKRLRKVSGSIMMEERSGGDKTRLFLLVLAGVFTSLFCGYKKFWEKCRGDY